jgi:hypothetical protein
MLKQYFGKFHIEILIYLACIIVILFLLKEQSNIENFNTKIKRKTIYSIIPSAIEPNLYFGSYITKSKDKNKGDVDNFVYTRSLKSNSWIKVPRNSLLNNKTLIFDMNYDENKRLMCIGLSMNKNEPIYDIFIKENTDYNSTWIKVESNNKIRSLCYDLNSNKLIGINSYDGQIYENKKESTGSYITWTGPINYDSPMKKVLFNREGIMLGIGLLDNYIYKKINKDWRNSNWDDKNINKTRVYDLFYDRDGCLIAATDNGVMKQAHPDFNSEFVKIEDFSEKHEDILTDLDVLKSRVGIEFIDDEFDINTELGRDLKRIYEFKKISKNLCNNKVPLRNSAKNDDNNSRLGKQNREINDLYKIIDDISSKMNY